MERSHTTKRLQAISEPVFLIPSDLPSLEFVDPNKNRRDDGIKKTNVVKTSNFGLLISRFIPHQIIRNDDKGEDRIIEIVKNKKTGKDEDKTYLTLRNFWFEHLPNNFTSANKELNRLISATHQRWLATTDGAERFTLVSRSRLIVGLGSKGALEFGITLHPVTGLPYIPGSALKGLCRIFFLLKIAEQGKVEVETKSLEALNVALLGENLDEFQLEPKFKRKLEKIQEVYGYSYSSLFGTKDISGKIIFFDAIVKNIPNGIPLFAADVMTPHFRQYYETNGKTAPHDADDPNPIMFVTVNYDTPFHFAVGYRKSAFVDADLMPLAQTLLQDALHELGIGGKTAAGYGVFRPRQNNEG